MSNKLLVRLFEAILQQDDKDFIEIYEQIVALLQEAKDDYINLRLQADEDNAVILDWLAKEAIEEVGGDWWAFTWLQDYAHKREGDDLEKTDPDDDGVWHSFTLLHDDDYEAWVKVDEDKDDE